MAKPDIDIAEIQEVQTAIRELDTAALVHEIDHDSLFGMLIYAILDSKVATKLADDITDSDKTETWNSIFDKLFNADFQMRSLDIHNQLQVLNRDSWSDLSVFATAVRTIIESNIV